MGRVQPCTEASALHLYRQVHLQLQYEQVVIQLSVVVAVMYTLIGLLRLGFITNILSHAVTSGFTSGAAVVIGLSQVCCAPHLQPQVFVKVAYVDIL